MSRIYDFSLQRIDCRNTTALGMHKHLLFQVVNSQVRNSLLSPILCFLQPQLHSISDARLPILFIGTRLTSRCLGNCFKSKNSAVSLPLR
jgi:hypothetical protein